MTKSLFRERLLVCDLTGRISIIQISGKDRETFLQNLCCNDIISLPVGVGCRNALLMRSSEIKYFFYSIKMPESLWLIGLNQNTNALIEYLEGFCFAEDVQFTAYDSSVASIFFCGIGCDQKMAAIFPTMESEEPYLPLKLVERKLPSTDGLIFSLPLTGDEGFLLAEPIKQKDETIQKLFSLGGDADSQFVTLGELQDLRVEAGFPLMGIDFDDQVLAPELGMGDRLISLQKGCYPGQEIIARIHSRGAVKQKLMGIKFSGHYALKENDHLTIDGKDAVILRSVGCLNDGREKAAFAYVKKPFYDQLGSVELNWNNQSIEAEICALPFYQSASILAGTKKFYDRGMSLYHQGQFRESIDEFLKALQISNQCADAYEAMAMSFEQMGDLDRAIAMNKRYFECDPMAVMSQTNLSRLYMKQGFKDLAEAAQTEATILKFKAASKNQVQGSKIAMAREQQKDAGKKRKISLFKEVLVIDPEDEVANFGLGKYRLEEHQYAAAIVHFRKVIAANPKHSLSYDLLARALLAQGESGAASAVLTQGISVAKENGDLMPLKSMEQLVMTI